MLAIFFLALAFWIVVGAARIILGWIASAETVRAVDAAVGKAFKLFFQLIVIALAGLIIYAVVASQNGP